MVTIKPRANAAEWIFRSQPRIFHFAIVGLSGLAIWLSVLLEYSEPHCWDPFVGATP